MNLAEYREDLVDALGLLPSDEMIPEASLNRSINKGMQRFARAFNWPFLQQYTTLTLVEDQDVYSLPVDMIRIVSVGINSDSLAPITLSEMVTRFDQDGRPTTFTLQAGGIKFAPVPTDVDDVKIVYVRQPPTLTDDVTDSLIPDTYADIVVVYAAIHQATRLKDSQLLTSFNAEKQELMRDAVKEVSLTFQAPRIKMRSDSQAY